MKIEKIELKNLASLEGEQVVDFMKEPLKSAGLFAIIGKTGAGKSTLLDAICIALYGKAPRFAEAENLRDVVYNVSLEDDKKLKNTDPRNILRRGCREGYSRVTFSLSNGCTYIAEWSVRLTRNNTFDDVKRRLKQISPHQETWEGKSKVQECINQLTGLEYKQFTSTIILAQNSFANFLNAKKGEKSKLLEKLTGTEIYGKMSQMVHVRLTEMDKTYEKFVSQLEGISENILAEEDLKKQQEALVMEKGKLTQNQDSLSQVERHLAWYKSYGQARAALAEKSKIKMNAQSDYNSLYSQKAQLERFDKVLPFQPLYNVIVEKKRNISRFRESISEEYKEQNLVKEQMALSEQKYKKTKDSLDTLNQEQQNKAALINKAHLLQGEITVNTNNLSIARKELSELQGMGENLRGNLASKKKNKEENENTYKLLKQELQAISMYRGFVEKVDAVKGNLQKLHEQYQEAHESQLQQEKIRKDMQEVETLKKDLSAKKAQMEDRYNALQRELETHLAANQDVLSQDIQNRIIHLSNLKRDTQNAKDLWMSIAKIYQEKSELEDEIRRIETEIKAMDNRIPMDSISLFEKKKRFEIAERSYQLSQNQNILDIRNNLKEGTPCPVCGATHHPYQVQTLNNLLNNLTQDYQNAKNEYEIAQKNYDEVMLQKSRKQVLLEEKKKYLEKLRQREESGLSQWERYVYLDKSFRDTSASVDATNRGLLLTHLLDNAIHELHNEEQRNEEYNRHQKAIKELVEKVQEVNNLLIENNRELTELVAREKMNNSMSETLKVRIKEIGNRAAVVYSLLEDILTIPSWKEKCETHYEDLIGEINAIAGKWNTNTAKSAELEKAIGQLDVEIQILDGQFSANMQKQTSLESSISALTENITLAEQSIRRFFNGMTLEEAQKDFQSRLGEAQKAETDAAEAFKNIKQRYDDITVRISSLSDLQQQTEKELHEKNSELDMQIARFNIDNSPLQYFELEKIFEDTCDWNALRAEIENKKAVLEKANFDKEKAEQELMELLRSENRPEESPDENELSCQARKEMLSRSQEEILSSLKKIQFALEKHEDAQKSLAGYEGRRKELEEELEKWRKLDNIIGSADGTKFREIAQGYTFDILVDYANVQLRSLTSRYMLQSKPHTLGLDIVDHDMLDEVRSVSSLSGGETFIISLGLALGLASLQSGQFKISSLFIDEGFGNLDEENLNIVIDALSRLQSTQGRKIGVISHTEQVQMRISPKIIVRKDNGGRSRIEIG